MDRGGRSESCDAQAGVICRGYVGILSRVRHKNRKARWHRGVIDFVLDLQLQIRDSFFIFSKMRNGEHSEFAGADRTQIMKCLHFVIVKEVI